MARKALILSRVCGWDLEMEDVQVEASLGFIIERLCFLYFFIP